VQRVCEGAPCPRCLALAQLMAGALASAPARSQGSGRGAGMEGSCWGGCASSPHPGGGGKSRHRGAWWVGRDVAMGCSVVWAVQVCRDVGWMHGAGADSAMQRLSKAASSFQSPIRPFLKLSPEEKVRREQPGGTKPARAQPVLGFFP